MSISRSSLGRGPAIITWNSCTFFGREDIMAKHDPVWAEVETSMYGIVDKSKKDLIIKIPLRLWGAYENLSTLFPSALLNPSAGTSLFGTSDLPLVIWGKNGDRITYANAQLTKLADLYLGVDSELYAADVEFTCLLKNATNPEAAGAYFVRDTSAYTDSAFAKTTYGRARFSGAWGAITGFTSIIPQKGFNVAWNLKLNPVEVDGLGTVDMTVESMVAAVKCIPIGPTMAQIDTNSQIATAHGTLLSASSADLTLTSTFASIVAKNAGLVSTSSAFSKTALRNGELMWESTRAFASGVPVTTATVG